ncbi:class I SAM-dependent methyltransferase [Actinokineospora globicatena]|uniref:class I SAM-dependent methyltransferase n=1 Tax=Actinokineospora globicatena TaxID=103729 RepID=UPI0020A432C7|nr:methyltransferase domain-containing protein [Actinokineospora globicatena]MCP2303641.1 Ubiquinone/menaquinone biosynthesis C-methylase UbiE [Actinokineospora globicatena]GLW79222.1 methyltransferase [Actinokineospora globicatena]GLW86368.1 methyltransferase [Actinokineospora globicatena]
MTVAALRAEKHEEWRLSAVGWVRYRANFADAAVPSARRMVELSGARPGQRALDLACGVGVPAHQLAQAVGPTGYVLGVDIAEDMVAGARAWAAAAGLDTVDFRTVPSEHELGVEPRSFDIGTCRAGLQYMVEPGAALRAMKAALRPGGRMVAMTVGSPQRCTSLRILEEVVARHITMPTLIPEPDKGVPGTVALSDPADLEALYRDAGFTDVRTEIADHPIVGAESAEEYWDVCEQSAGPFILLLRSIGADLRAAIRADAIATLRAEFDGGPVVMTGETLITVGTS